METKGYVTLRQRKDQVEITLRYLENQRRELEDNVRWLTRPAYERRLALLDEVAEWYRDELAHMDRRMAGN
jgi:hypothetical protein